MSSCLARFRDTHFYVEFLSATTGLPTDCWNGAVSMHQAKILMKQLTQRDISCGSVGTHAACIPLHTFNLQPSVLADSITVIM
jgi:hypothetical protein